MIKCGKCGNELFKTDVMCNSCHTTILELKQTNNIIFETVPKFEEEIAVPVKKKNKFSKYFIILAGIALLSTGGYYLTMSFILKDKSVDKYIDQAYVVGKRTDREILSFLKYATPEAWTRNSSFDELYLYEVDYFDYKDKKSTLMIRVIEPEIFDTITGDYIKGVNKEQWITNLKSSINSDDIKVIEETYNGIVWTKIYGKINDENKFTKAVYMYISLDGNSLYMIETNEYISDNKKDNETLAKSIKYILENAKPQK